MGAQSKARRLDLFRETLAFLREEERKRKRKEQAQIVAEALREVLPTTQDGALRVHSESGSSVKGGA